MIFHELNILQLKIGDYVLHLPSGRVDTITSVDTNQLYGIYTGSARYDRFGFFYNIFSEFDGHSMEDIKRVMYYPTTMRIIPYDNKRINPS
jgi:hypothetical protein